MTYFIVSISELLKFPPFHQLEELSFNRIFQGTLKEWMKVKINNR